MRRLLWTTLFLMPLAFAGGCRVEKLDTGPSWSVNVKFPLGDTAESFYNIARFVAGGDSSKIIRQGDEVYWKEVGREDRDTLITPDSAITVVYVDFNKPGAIKRGAQGIILRDVYAVVRLYIDTVKADVDLKLKAIVLFKESGTSDTIEITGLTIPANSRYFEYTIRDLYIRAESTVVYAKAYGYSSYTGEVMLLDSSVLEVYAPMHLEAHDTLVVENLMDVGLNDSVSMGDASVVSATVHLFSRRSIPMVFLVDAWLKDTVTNVDSMFVASIVLRDPPKDPSGYSTGFVYDTIVLSIDTAGVRFINEHAGQVRLKISGYLPGNPVDPYRAYIKAEDSLGIWGYVETLYDINRGGGQ